MLGFENFVYRTTIALIILSHMHDAEVDSINLKNA